MPPKIQAKKVTVTEEFVETMIAMYGDWLMKNQALIQQAIRTPKLEHIARTAKRLLPIVRRQSPSAREGLDYEITRLYHLPFKEFFSATGPNPQFRGTEDIRWLVARTNHITATNYARRTEIKGELGSYCIYMPSTLSSYPNLGHLHMIPDRNPLSSRRHFHHYIHSEGITRSPLDYPTGNCWGDYGGTLKGMIDQPDYPALLQQLHRHLGTYGDRPPVRALDFNTEIKE